MITKVFPSEPATVIVRLVFNSSLWSSVRKDRSSSHARWSARSDGLFRKSLHAPQVHPGIGMNTDVSHPAKAAAGA